MGYCSRIRKKGYRVRKTDRWRTEKPITLVPYWWNARLSGPTMFIIYRHLAFFRGRVFFYVFLFKNFLYLVLLFKGIFYLIKEALLINNVFAAYTVFVNSVLLRFFQNIKKLTIFFKSWKWNQIVLEAQIFFFSQILRCTASLEDHTI